MEKYYDSKSTKQIGERIRTVRNDKGYSMADISAMTGFSVNAISAMELGKEFKISYFIGVCQACEVHPAEMLNFSIELKARFELPPERKDRAMVTRRLNDLVKNSDFFDTPKLVDSVLNEILNKYSTKANSSEVSTGLKRLSDEGFLEFKKMGRRNRYYKPKKGSQ